MVEDPFNFTASQHHYTLVCGSTTKVVDVLKILLRLLSAAPVPVSVLLQCQLLPAQVAESVFVYHHGKLSSSPVIFQCSVSDRIFTLKHCADTPLHVWVAIMLESYLHTLSLSARRGLKTNFSIKASRIQQSSFTLLAEFYSAMYFKSCNAFLMLLFPCAHDFCLLFSTCLSCSVCSGVTRTNFPMSWKNYCQMITP